MTDADPRARYLRWAAEHEAARDAARRSSLRIGTARVATFLALAGALLVVDVRDGAIERVAMALAAVLAVAFFAEISLHRRARRQERWHETLRGLAREGVLRMDRRWRELAAELPASESAGEAPPAGHSFARDLDVVGEASLVRLLGPVTSQRGRAILRRWLLDDMAPAAAAARQEAVRELAPEAELRATVAAHGRLHAGGESGALSRFLEWTERRAVLPAQVSWVAALMSASLLALVAGQFFLGWPPLWVVPAALQIELLRRYWRVVSAELPIVEEGGIPLNGYVPQIALLESATWSAPRLTELTERLKGGAAPASVELRRLARLRDTVESRRNLVYASLNPLLLLDLHLGAALDRWRARSGASVRRWLDGLGTWEALSALGTAAHDHPRWTFPAFTAGVPPVVHAVAMGHPLLAPSACVRNDVDVGPPGGFLLVTGSNMSGKSTLLRALGANVVLAAAGGPVCADELVVPHVRVRTTMRVEDSVTEGVSLFMAELLRIREVVTAADEDGGAPVLYLLDEILHGTNTAERRVAARAVVRHLVGRGAIGAVSTHDLTLADAPDLRAAAEAVHFREQVVPDQGRTRLTFDYRLRPGLATTRNALKLLDAVGLGGLEGLDEP